jgi:hypothetical protein
MKVYLAMYSTGFMDSQSEILAVCASYSRALNVIDTHMVTRDRTLEYRDRADWWVDEKEVVE